MDGLKGPDARANAYKWLMFPRWSSLEGFPFRYRLALPAISCSEVCDLPKGLKSTKAGTNSKGDHESRKNDSNEQRATSNEQGSVGAIEEAVTNKVEGERIRVPDLENDGPPPGPVPWARQ